jgi:creatinine amidohydrolase
VKTAWYEEFSWEEIREAAASDVVVIVPFGSVEPHGRHLPLGVDRMIVEEIARRAAPSLLGAALITPVVPFGYAKHHMDFPGAASIDPEHLIAFAEDLGRTILRHGFRRLLFLNGHAGNASALDLASKEITLQSDGICALANWWVLARDEIVKCRESQFPGGISHACELETSVMLVIRPDLVEMEKAERDINFPRGRFLWRDLFPPSPVSLLDVWSRISRTGAIGDPTRATAEKGGLILEAATLGLLDLVAELRGYPIRPRVDHHGATSVGVGTGTSVATAASHQAGQEP